MSKHSNDVAKETETPGKKTIFVARRIYHVEWVVTLYHDCKTSTCCNRCIFSLTPCEVLPHVAFVGCNIKHLFHENLLPITF